MPTLKSRVDPRDETYQANEGFVNSYGQRASDQQIARGGVHSPLTDIHNDYTYGNVPLDAPLCAAFSATASKAGALIDDLAFNRALEDFFAAAENGDWRGR